MPGIVHEPIHSMPTLLGSGLVGVADYGASTGFEHPRTDNGGPIPASANLPFGTLPSMSRPGVFDHSHPHHGSSDAHSRNRDVEQFFALIMSWRSATRELAHAVNARFDDQRELDMLLFPLLGESVRRLTEEQKKLSEDYEKLFKEHERLSEMSRKMDEVSEAFRHMF